MTSKKPRAPFGHNAEHSKAQSLADKKFADYAAQVEQSFTVTLTKIANGEHFEFTIRENSGAFTRVIHVPGIDPASF